MKYKIIVINGPNLNLLGEREKEKYGNTSLKDVENQCLEFAQKNDIEITFYQSNIEGEIVNSIQNSRNNQDALIINAGGYTHTSVALTDCVKAIETPVIEVHISNIYAREDFRKKSLLSTNCKAVICGLGLNSYKAVLLTLK